MALGMLIAASSQVISRTAHVAPHKAARILRFCVRRLQCCVIGARGKSDAATLVQQYL